MSHSDESKRRASRLGQIKKEYSPPSLDHIGSIREITQMPGGSVNTEGSSGKAHQQ